MIDRMNCILCHSLATPELVSSSVRDDNHFRVVRCLTCGHVQLDPLPSEEDDAKFYADDQQTRRLVGDVDFDLLRSNTTTDTQRRVDWLRSVASPQAGAVLDVGCGYGFYVEALVQAGYRATGLDVSHARVSLARMHTEGEFINGSIDEDFTIRYAASFHVITLFHVLEHVRTPMNFLHDCAKLATSGGKLLLEVPNLNDELLEVQAAYRAFYWQRAHLSYFDPA
ncbi:class I SAM-dependent methyltransferase [Candidatus Viridilinea mediisalina]|uniref:Methyltransferase type 11 n=1 Tax=Candidatus Viridilinea mediisalina TaxID=2024553 RepID=A0A2A6RM93_9CHLR|nr:methyltransferase domain-containing protein [Candidatus Viridilinea mediisalina]PDW04026.1 hypothetical protein CJ255_05490 [Candidatus Viridilinea mediisalina]